MMNICKKKNYASGLRLFKKSRNVIILRTFSKIYGLASLRIGWGYGPKKIIDAMNIIKPPFNVNMAAQLAAVAALNDKSFINKSVKHNLIWANKIKKFLNKSIDILVSTTVIEVGIDFPNANVIIIENANKFGLSQLHQLRGRVGRGKKQATCILMFKSNLSENARKRINILKNSNDGFEISEEDMKLRGFGDLLGFKQSGIKNFRLADPIQNQNLFFLAENEIKKYPKDRKASAILALLYLVQKQNDNWIPLVAIK